MKALYELIELLPPLFVPTFQKRLNDLFLFLKKEKEQLSEKEAAKRFSGGRKKNNYFNELKNKLKKELTRYLIANPSWSDNKYNTSRELLSRFCYL